MSGLYVLLVFAVFAALMYRRAMPALLAVPLMAVLMAAVAGVPAAGIADIVVLGSWSLGGVFIAVIFGAMLGRITIDTGIARTIVNFAAEFAGDRPPVVAAVLCLVVAALFVSLAGLGAIIMVGSIVLPIMMTGGVPRKIAATLFLMSFALGYIFNIANWKFYTKFFGVAQQELYGYALVLAAIDLLALVIYAVIAFRQSRDYATWATKAPEAPTGVPAHALLTPVLPIVLYYAFHLDPIIAFPLAAVYGVLTTRPRRAVDTLVAGAIRGFEDVAPAVLLFIGIGMLVTATKQPQFVAALQPLVTSSALHNPVVFVALFGLLSPLALYRGPLNPFGVGIAIFTVLLAAHVFPPIVLVAAIMAVVQVQNVCDPTNTQNVWVGNFTGVRIEEITRRTLPYQVAVATLGAIVIVTGGRALFHAHPFASVVQRADAAEAAPGLFSPPGSANSIAVGVAGGADAAAAAQAVIGSLNAAPPLRAFRLDDDPNATPCTGKAYAAFLRLTSTRFVLEEGTDLDVGMELLDCGGWTLDEWHEHRIVAHPGAQDARALGAATTARLRLWIAEHPRQAASLFTRGLAYDDRSDRPTFYYSFYKTVDGNMRAYVRPGGPAYIAGMRTNDVVDKLDGKFWWEYGTYQTQLRAYDGKPHEFDVTRGGQSYHVKLTLPFAGAAVE